MRERDKMKKFWGIAAILLVIFVGVGFTWQRLNSQAQQPYITNQEETNFWLITDPHFIAPSLHDDGEAFQFIKSTAAGKDLEYQEESLAAFVEKVLAAKPTGVIITGDLTLNGEKASAEKLQEIFEPIREAGIFVFCIPGNHDIHDGWARSFEGDQQVVTDQISPNDFKKMFADGFEQATSLDEDSLSYTIELNQRYRLFFLDTNIYSDQPTTSSPTTSGVIAEDSLAWLKQQLEEVEGKNQIPIVFMHHNLYVHNSHVNKGYVLNNADDVKTMFAQYNVPVVFSGHIHAQDIIGPDVANGPHEIVTSAFTMTDQAYGIIELNNEAITYQRENLIVDDWAKEQDITNPDLLQHQAYLRDLFLKDSLGMTYSTAYRTGDFSDTQLTNAADLVAELNWNFFTGNDQYTATEKTSIQNSPEYLFLKERSSFLSQYLDTLMIDEDRDDLFRYELP